MDAPRRAPCREAGPSSRERERDLAVEEYMKVGGAMPLDPPRNAKGYRGTSLIRKRSPLGPYRRPMPKVFGGS